jgi:hypothetical protein
MSLGVEYIYVFYDHLEYITTVSYIFLPFGNLVAF